MIRTGYDLWARLLSIGSAPPSLIDGGQLECHMSTDKAPLMEVQHAARSCVLLNIDSVIDIISDAAMRDGQGLPSSEMLSDHLTDQPFPTTLFWWRRFVAGHSWVLAGCLSDTVGYAPAVGMTMFLWADDWPDLIVPSKNEVRMVEGMVAAVNLARVITSCTDIRVSIDPSSPRWIKQSRERDYPFVEFKTVDIPRVRTVHAALQTHDADATPRSAPRYHPVRRHLVHRRNGSIERRGPFWRGDPSKGILFSSYRTR